MTVLIPKKYRQRPGLPLLYDQTLLNIMPPRAVSEKLIHDALELPKGARAFLASTLLESLDHEEENFDIPEHVLKEIDALCERIDAGEVEMTPAEEVFKRIEAKLK